MVLIRLPDGTDWFKANWVFRQLAEDTVGANPDNRELRSVLDAAQAHGALFLDSMDARAASVMVRAIGKVAEDTVAGTVPGWQRTRPEDSEGQRIYLESITELLHLMKAKAGAA